MILTAHQPVYLPWLGLFHKIALADTFVVFDTVQYLKKDWNNRNKIKTAQGLCWLTVPVLTHQKFTQSLLEVAIDNSANWRKKHLKSIEINYAKAPFFEKYISFFRDLYKKEWGRLIDINDVILHFLLQEMRIKTKILYGHNLKLEGKKSDLVLDMCIKLRASTYIFGALGRDYADMEKFNKKGIGVIFQDYHHPVYSQQFGEFLPYASAIDLLFNCGEKSLEIIMSGNIAKNSIKDGSDNEK